MNFLQRHWVSVTLAATVTGLLVTGALAYTRPYSETNTGIHTAFGILFSLGLIFHLRHNLRSLAGYLRQRPKALWSLAAGLLLVVVISILFQLPPLHSAVAFGRALRGQADTDEEALTVIHTRPGTTGAAVEIIIKPGQHYFSHPIEIYGGLLEIRSVPQLAIWVEDMEGNYLETLYVTGKAATAGWQKVNPFNTAVVRRPEALPRWAHQRGKVVGGEIIPTAENPLPDAITAATPLNTHIVSSKLPTQQKRMRIFLEVNRSFDFNDYWHPQRFPEDPIYTSGGASGQPALIYSTELDLASLDDGQMPVPLRLIGHAHHSGQTGEIYPDLTGYDTALSLLDWALIQVRH